MSKSRNTIVVAQSEILRKYEEFSLSTRISLYIQMSQGAFLWDCPITGAQMDDL